MHVFGVSASTAVWTCTSQEYFVFASYSSIQLSCCYHTVKGLVSAFMYVGESLETWHVLLLITQKIITQ